MKPFLLGKKTPNKTNASGWSSDTMFQNMRKSHMHGKESELDTPTARTERAHTDELQKFRGKPC